MMRSHLQGLALSSALVLGASAGTLQLSAGGTIDISSLNLTAVGDMSIGNGRLWISEGANNGILYQFNTNGSPLGTLSPGLIPGLTGGPDAIAAIGNPQLALFSSFGQSVAGLVNWTTATLNAGYPSAEAATGAEFTGELWIASGTAAGAGSVLKRLNHVTGAVLATVTIPGLNVRIVDLAHDPVDGGMYALCEDDQLREIDLTTGAIVSTQDLAPLLIGHQSPAGGMDFDADGARLFIANGQGAGADSIVILNRTFSTNVCGSQLGTFTCPCTNVGAVGRGCRNSIVGNSGAFLTSTGRPRLSNDDLVLAASFMPPGTFVLFFQATVLNATPTAFGDGALCVGGTITRLSVEAAPSGTAAYPAGGEPSVHALGQVPPLALSTRYYQGWYRDAATFCTTSTFNLTNAIEVLWHP
jgi:hypothetical protein